VAGVCCRRCRAGLGCSRRHGHFHRPPSTLANPLPAVVLTGDELDVRPGEWLLQTAAGSIVGQSVIQLGAHVGFKTLNVVRRRSAVEDILALRGTAVICTEDEDLHERVADIAGHDGASKAIDCVSGEWGADESRALAPHGELVVYGARPRTAKPIPTNSPSRSSRAH
jgi:NADPH:quinone reductase-like Zn-dependent oxidoreductase